MKFIHLNTLETMIKTIFGIGAAALASLSPTTSEVKEEVVAKSKTCWKLPVVKI